MASILVIDILHELIGLILWFAVLRVITLIPNIWLRIPDLIGCVIDFRLQHVLFIKLPSKPSSSISAHSVGSSCISALNSTGEAPRFSILPSERIGRKYDPSFPGIGVFLTLLKEYLIRRIVILKSKPAWCHPSERPGSSGKINRCRRPNDRGIPQPSAPNQCLSVAHHARGRSGHFRLWGNK